MDFSYRVTLPRGTIVAIVSGVHKGEKGRVVDNAYSSVQRVEIELYDGATVHAMVYELDKLEVEDDGPFLDAC